MTKNRLSLRRGNSPIKSPLRHNSSLKKKALVRRISGEVHFGAASKANLKVVVRVRPQNQREDEKGARCVVNVLDDHMLVLDPSEDSSDVFFFKGTKTRCRDLSKRQPLDKKFAFEHVFGGQSTNAQLYEATAHPLIDTLLQGYNCSVFAYGATGAGKTYTMLGRPEFPGIISLTLQELYQRLSDLKGHKQCEVAVSYLEVYNETVRDLLGTGKPLALQEMGKQVMVPGLSLHKPSNAEELLQMLARGNSNRTQHATDANAESSRSHAVFQIFVRQQDLEASAKAAVTISKLSMIDLAGSERGAATGFRGMRFKEGSSINKSLLALGNCINALADGQRHIPYRDSKLTRLLKDSLGGNCRSVMIAAMSPASTSFEDTYNTLRYAERAKTIRTTIRNNVKNVDQHVSDYIKIVAGLREEVASLREKLKEYQEKEENWQTERSELVRGVAPVTPRVASVPQEKKDQDEICEEEVEAQKHLKDIGAEQKALRQELLQLEAAYKATMLKRHHWNARLARVQVVAFASAKLDKTIHKCERTISALEKRLGQILLCIETVKKKVAANLAKMQEAQETLICYGSDPDCLSKSSQNLMEKHEANIILRDSYQLGEHLQTLVRENVKEQNTSEQLIHLLLGGVRDLYLQLYQKDQCGPEVRGIFQHVVDGLDECRIMWADQQSVAEGGTQTATDGQPVLTPLNADQITLLPSLATPFLSPTIPVDPTPSFRQSIMMANVNGSIQSHQSSDVRTNTSSTMKRPRPGSPPDTPLETKQPHTLNTTVTLTSPMPSATANAKFRENTYDTIPSASRLSSFTVNKLVSPARPLNTTIDVPSSNGCHTVTPSLCLTTTSDPPSASKLSYITPISNGTTLNTTINLQSPLLLSIHAAAPVNNRLSAAHSDTKLLNGTSQLSPRDIQPLPLLPVAAEPVSSVVSSTTTTSTSASGPPVSRKLFERDTEGLNSTFSIAAVETVIDPSTIPLPPEPARDIPSRSPRGIGAAAARSPLTSVSNRSSHSNLLSIPEKQPLKPSLVRGFRGIANRKGMSRTPHKNLAQTFTPGKTLTKEPGMRRCSSTPSLTQQTTSRHPSSSIKKLKGGLGGTLHRTTSFLKGRTNNQENVPPMRRPSTGVVRSTSPSASRQHLSKA